MTTTVVNVKVAHIRPRHQDLQAWCADPGNAYIGRGGIVFIDGKRFPPAASPFANPFKCCGTGAALSREDSLRMYRGHITKRLAQEPELRAALEALRGKNLGCWCAPLSCHGDVLRDLLHEAEVPLVAPLPEAAPLPEVPPPPGPSEMQDAAAALAEIIADM